MFYMLVFSGLAFFVFGVASTLYNSLKIQREYELVTTELVRTDSSLRDLEIRYADTQNELKTFKINIEASNGWTKEGIDGTRGELEKMRTEYVRVKLGPGKENPFNVLKVREKCDELIKESEEYNKLLARRNDELSKLKGVFDDIKSRLEANQAAISATQEELKGLKTSSETQEKLKSVIKELEDLKEKDLPAKAIKEGDSAVIEEAKTADQESPETEKPPEDSADSGIHNDADRKHLETMRSFLNSLDDKPLEDYDLENNDIRDGE